MQCENVADLTSLLRENGHLILDTSSKLSLSTTLLRKVNESLYRILVHIDGYDSTPFFALSSTNDDDYFHLHYLYDFIQKTIALKLLPPEHHHQYHEIVDIQLFKNLRLLEVHRFSTNLIKGLQYLRAQLEHLVCVRSVDVVRDLLESCGADRTSGHAHWRHLRQATFSHNSIEHVDNSSFQLTPELQTLDLSHNRLSSVTFLNCLPNLRCLDLSVNRLQQCPQLSGAICSQLRVLNLRYNLIDDIAELATSVNITALDLSHNCLVDHRQLEPISCLSLLEMLVLTGNPLSYHHDHRRLTLSYLHTRTTNRKFMLDGETVSAKELRHIGAKFSSMHSATTATTSAHAHRVVVDVHHRHQSDVDDTASIISTDEDDDDDGGSSSQLHASSIETVIAKVANTASEATVMTHAQQHTLMMQEQAMQDSGFVSGPRPASPNDSIGSATSLHQDKGAMESSVIYGDSDIEVLSNPSQSSIEVIDSGPLHSNLIYPTINAPTSTNTEAITAGRRKNLPRSL